jgi:hypothetical protein
MATGNWCKGIANSLEKSIIKGLNPLSPLFKPSSVLYKQHISVAVSHLEQQMTRFTT